MAAATIPAWVGILVTLAIAVVSLATANRANHIARSDRDDREAARVSAWISFVFSNENPEDEAGWSNVLVIRNASDAVIHNVEAVALMNGSKEIIFQAKVCPPGESFSEWNHPKNRKYQRRAWELLSSCEELVRTDHTLRPFTRADNWTLESMSFTDALGKRWKYVAGRGVVPA